MDTAVVAVTTDAAATVAVPKNNDGIDGAFGSSPRWWDIASTRLNRAVAKNTQFVQLLFLLLLFLPLVLFIDAMAEEGDRVKEDVIMVVLVWIALVVRVVVVVVADAVVVIAVDDAITIVAVAIIMTPSNRSNTQGIQGQQAHS